MKIKELGYSVSVAYWEGHFFPISDHGSTFSAMGTKVDFLIGRISFEEIMKRQKALSKQYINWLKPIQVMKLQEVNQRFLTSPLIPLSVVEKMPSLIKDACSKFNLPREKDVFLTSLLGVLSGCTPNIFGRYHTLKLFPHMYYVIAAPAGNGKGNALFARSMGWPLHEQRKQKQQPQEFPVKYRRWGQYLPANTSVAMFQMQLAENGKEAILFESEIDTLTNSLSQDWGDISCNLREAFQHETITNARKGEGEGISIEIENPKVALILTGTPLQVYKLLPNLENGLFSRMLFYVFKQDIQTISVKPKNIEGGFVEYFKTKGQDIIKMASFLEANACEFKLSDDQWDKFDEFVNSVIGDNNASHGDDTYSSSIRLGISTFRIAMVLSAVRKWENQSVEPDQFCTDDDFESAKTLSHIYMQHSLILMETMPQSSIQAHVKTIDKFLQQLPFKFTRSEAIEFGKTLKLSDSTIDRALNRFVSEEKLKKVMQGQYEKPI
jgi:hypothetical protein